MPCPRGLPAGASVALTGGIGSGKSTVAGMLVACGAHLVDTDAIARALCAPGGAALPALVKHFGPEMLAADGALSRDRMRSLVFASPQAKAALEALLHPLIASEAERQASLRAGRPLLFDVPLLSRASGWRARVTRVLVVDCTEATQIRRVSQRPGWNAALAQAVVAQQIGRSERRALADAVIDNEAIGLPDLQRQAQALWQRWFPRHDDQGPQTL